MTSQKTLLELLNGDGPLYEIIYDLEECYDRHLEILKAEEKAIVSFSHTCRTTLTSQRAHEGQIPLLCNHGSHWAA